MDREIFIFQFLRDKCPNLYQVALSQKNRIPYQEQIDAAAAAIEILMTETAGEKNV